jgi:nitroreductase
MIDEANADLLLTTTRSVRKRLDFSRPVPLSLIEECLTVALQAPTGGNRQRWKWVIVTDQDKRAALAELYRKGWAIYLPGAQERYDPSDARQVAHQSVQDSAAYLAEHFHEVPALVIPFFEGPLDSQPFGWVNMAFASTMPAVWSFMLAARVRGLGTTLTTLTGLFLDDVNKMLGVPEGYTHLATIPVAYYLGDSFKPGRRLPVEDVTFHNSWGERTA